MNILAIIYKIIEFFNGELTKENYYSIAWVFSRICIAGIAAMVFSICSINMNYYFGILGIILTVLNTTLYTHANFSIVDVPMTFFITLFFLRLTFLYSKSNWRVRDIAFLSIITGIAIAMKYTAALLVPVLFFVSTQYIQKKKTYILRIEIIKKTLLYFGISLLLVYVAILIKQQNLLNYFKGLTTDGILEIEYIRTFHNFTSLIIIIGVLLIIASFLSKSTQKTLFSYVISPFHVYTILILLTGFTLFSPYTLIEFKRSFADFMYEYRHMKIGSAAQYHHLSDEYRNLISNLSSTASVIFYIQLIYGNLGIIGIIFSLCGIYSMYLNVAVRYTLSIFPIMIVFIMHWLFTVYQIISQNYSFNKY